MPLPVSRLELRAGSAVVQGTAFYLGALQVDIQKLGGMCVSGPLGPIFGPRGGIGERQNKIQAYRLVGFRL